MAERPVLTAVPGAVGRGPGSHGTGGHGLQRAVRVRPRNAGRAVARLWSSFRGERRGLGAILGCVIVDAGLGMVGPYLIGKAVDVIAGMSGGTGALVSVLGLSRQPLAALLLAGCALAAAYAGSAILQALEGWLVAVVSQRTVRGVREGLFGAMQRLPLSFFDTRSRGDIMSRLTNDVDAVSVTISQSAVQLLSGAVVVTGTLAIMLWLHPLLAVVSLAPVPFVFLLTRGISRGSRALFKEYQDALGALGGHIEETMSGIQAVKAFGREPHSRARFAAINDRLRRAGTRAQILAGFLMPLMNVFGNLSFAAVAVTGGLLAARGLITVGLIATFISYSRQFVRPLNDIADSWNTLMAAVAGAERVFEVMDETPEQADTEQARELALPRGEVEFREVSFAYRADVPVLRGVSFRAPAGSVTAIVGRTGAGKTTIVNLLSRFYEISSGAILIDGIDIRGYTRASLRRAFGVVLQDGWLFAGSVRENIMYGRPDASEEDMREAAAVAGAAHAIERLPQGYDTVLAESGANLSQGQRQLIAIARAVLAAPALLVLDEATSSVDARTELHIQQGMIELMKGRTSFIIAHRLSTIRDADTVLVVEAGRIVERGSPEELAAGDGYFRKLSDAQLRGIEI